jgi:hypothetical protein
MGGWLCGFALAAAMFIAAGAATAATTPSSAAKTCHSGYVHATLTWGERCLRAGQYCKKVDNPQYHKYVFQCVNGKLMKQPGLRKGITKGSTK